MWHLVQTTTKYPNPAVGTVVQREWMQLTTIDGEQRWYRETGTWIPRLPSDEVLDSVSTVEWWDLPMERTSLHESLVKHRARLDDEGADLRGWLDPEGKLYRVRYRSHDAFANIVLRQTVRHLERNGWARICGGEGESWRWLAVPSGGPGLSEKQAEFALNHNLNRVDD